MSMGRIHGLFSVSMTESDGLDGTKQKLEAVLEQVTDGSGLTAQELCHRLNRIGKACIFLQDGHTNLEYASVAGKKDLVICFSYSGETKEVYLAAEQARKNDVPVVAVTRNRPSRLSAAAVVIGIPELEKRVRVGAFASVTSQIFVIDVLYMSLIQTDFDRYKNMLLDTSRIANRLRE